MIALTAALGAFHIAQQAIHFRVAQLSISTHRTVTGHGRQQLILIILNAFAAAMFKHI